MRTLLLLSLLVLGACGGGAGEPEAEATWETHTTGGDDGAATPDDGGADDDVGE